MIFLTSPAAFSVRVTPIESAPSENPSRDEVGVQDDIRLDNLSYRGVKPSACFFGGPRRAMHPQPFHRPGDGLDRELDLFPGREPAEPETQAGTGHLLVQAHGQ